MLHLNTYDEIIEFSKKEPLYLLFYKKGSSASDCSYKNFLSGVEYAKVSNYFIFDVTDEEHLKIAKQLKLKSVPTFLLIKDGQILKEIKGCQKDSIYKKLFLNVSVNRKEKSDKKLDLIVYSTPSCPWCNRLKAYLRQLGIPFVDIDVSKDEQRAIEMQNKSGQSGVPQIEINGQIVVGFDKPKINQLLGIE